LGKATYDYENPVLARQGARPKIVGPDYEEDCEDERFHQRFLRQQGDFQNAWLDYAGLSHIIECAIAEGQACQWQEPNEGNEQFKAYLADQLDNINKYYHTSIHVLTETADKLILMREDGVSVAHSYADFKQEINRLITFCTMNYIAVLKVVEKRNRFLSTLLNEDLRITETLLEQHFVKRMATYDLEAFAESMQHPLWGWNPDRTVGKLTPQNALSFKMGTPRPTFVLGNEWNMKL